MRHRMIMLVWVLLISSLGFAPLAKAQDHSRNSESDQLLLADHDKHMKRVKIRGVVESISGRECVIRTSRGRHVRVLIGPESYWEYRGYRLVPGESVAVYGWYPEDSDDLFFAGTIAGSGFSFSLTTSSGVPEWVEEDEHHRMEPSIVLYREWYGPQYIYNVPPGREEGKRSPPGHDDKERQGHREHEK